MDVISIDDMECLVKGVVDKFGLLDIWVNNVGGLLDGILWYLICMLEDKFVG